MCLQRPYCLASVYVHISMRYSLNNGQPNSPEETAVGRAHDGAASAEVVRRVQFIQVPVQARSS